MYYYAALSSNAIATGHGFTCTVSRAGIPICWGSNVWGQLGNSNTSNVFEPTALDLGTGGTRFKFGVGRRLFRSHTRCLAAAQPTNITAGAAHTCVLLRSGGIMCWGLNDHGQVGSPTGMNISSGVVGPTVVALEQGSLERPSFKF
jgi:alpha-tubulin suppressor-like RCC1 family protein